MKLALQLFHQALSATSMALTFGFPVAIFTFVGFARLTSLTEAISAFSICSIMAGLSWVGGRGMEYVVAGQFLATSPSPREDDSI